ncbi:phage antirepressor KilAC domain-containing protein [Corynebacterium sp. TAE3-ERU16]|nr:phage antirepressor KilAC domain-containing protein [Corynebacterium sp. TAE3-ERU16]
MPLMGYPRWNEFKVPVTRAIKAAENQSQDIASLFRASAEKTAGRPREDFHLTRFAAYLVAMNGDPNKPEVAAAQAYFAIKTREAETTMTPETIEATLSNPDFIIELATTLKHAQQQAAENAARARRLEPAAHAWTHLAAANGDMSVAETAKILSRDPNINIGRDRLFHHMHTLGWIFRTKGRRSHWEARQTQIDTGRLVHRAGTTFQNRTTGEMELGAPTIRVTAKGLEALRCSLTTSPQQELVAATTPEVAR